MEAPRDRKAAKQLTHGRKIPRTHSPEQRTRAAALLEEFNAARAAVLPGSRPLAPLPANLDGLLERLTEGHTDEDVRHVLRVRQREVDMDPTAGRWFVPETVFRQANFARSLAMRVEDVHAPKGTGDRVMNPKSRRALAEEF